MTKNFIAVEFPEAINVLSGRHNNETATSYNRARLEELYEAALIISKTSKQASCQEWVEKLNIHYGAAILLMDMMEYREKVKPLVYKDGAPESSGPRKLKS